MIEKYLSQLALPSQHSHKGQNGKTLIIGGSDLFHAASQWSFRVISRLVDMTFYSSVAENNKLLHDAKLYGTDGVIVPRAELPNYLSEVQSVLIGPGMRRDKTSRFTPETLTQIDTSDLTPEDWEQDTTAVTAALLQEFPDKRWVIDAGALQVLHPSWLPPQSVLTPHRQELVRLAEKLPRPLSFPLSELYQQLDKLAEAYFQSEDSISPLLIEESMLPQWLNRDWIQELKNMATTQRQAHFIVKGAADLLWNVDQALVIVGGNAGLTKGGTGDVLAGLVAGLTAGSEPWPSLVVASYLNKLAGHSLYQERKTMYNTSDLVEELPKVWGKVV